MKSCVSRRRRLSLDKLCKRIISQEDVSDHDMDGNAEECTVDTVSYDKVEQALRDMKTGVPLYHWTRFLLAGR